MGIKRVWDLLPRNNNDFALPCQKYPFPDNLAWICCVQPASAVGQYYLQYVQVFGFYCTFGRAIKNTVAISVCLLTCHLLNLIATKNLDFVPGCTS